MSQTICFHCGSRRLRRWTPICCTGAAADAPGSAHATKACVSDWRCAFTPVGADGAEYGRAGI
ncbi:hypothetical protein [Schaalia hyovaginalis]|uniref:Uncharacterized protein n=1 Tax=Schaalia hyovaginalis TaxID=29316 RepID=A0A923IYH5_9ACTO|nr:hypothetical protein [Schaalia hyovaginalis]MBB6333634.1 hypothetical protein [Schaalia hyovaginalis]MDY2669766.1 hypothetical protein [Schaalia hyovaginalis]